MKKTKLEKMTDKAMRDKRNRKHFELLTTHLPFKNLIKEIREDFGIPVNGFTSEKEVEKWQEGQAKKDDEIIKSKKFKEKEEEIRNNFKLSKIDKNAANEHMSLFCRKLPINKFTNACNGIMRNFKLPVSFDMAVRIYILYGKLLWIPLLNYGFRIEKDKLSIDIYSKLTKEEIDDLLKVIRIFNKNLIHITKVSKKTEAQLKVEESILLTSYYQEGDKKITKKEITKDYFGKKGKPQQVYDSRRLLEKKRGRRFG